MLTLKDPSRDDWKQGKFRKRLPLSRVFYIMLLLPCLAEFLIVDYPVLIHISLCTNILVYSRVRWFTSTLMLFTMLHSIKAGLGIRSSDIRANRSFFAQKWVNERFAQKNERFTHLPFLVSEMSDSLTIAHFLWAPWANCSWSLIFGEQPERFAHIAHFWWAN